MSNLFIQIKSKNFLIFNSCSFSLFNGISPKCLIRIIGDKKIFPENENWDFLKWAERGLKQFNINKDPIKSILLHVSINFLEVMKCLLIRVHSNQFYFILNGFTCGKQYLETGYIQRSIKHLVCVKL